MAKVLIVTVTTSYGDVRAETRKALENLKRGEHVVDWIVLTEQLEDAGDEWTVGPTIWHNLNKARRFALKEGYDYLLSLEWDVVPPPDALLTLISDDADVAVGLYPERPSKVGSTLGGRLLVCNPGNSVPEAEEKVKLGIPFRITHGDAGLGCVLVNRTVMENHPFSWVRGWYKKIYEKKLRVLLDPRVLCCHVNRDGSVIKPII